VDMWGRLRTLVRLGHEVHAVITVKNRPPEDEISHIAKIVSRLDIVNRRANWKCIAASRPVQTACRDGLKRVALMGHYDLALAETEFSFSIFENEALNADLRVLRIQNDESRFMRELEEVEAKEGSLKRIYYHEESRRFSRFSPKAFAAVDQLWFISSDEYEQYLRAHPEDRGKAAWLPPPIDVDAFIPPTVKSSKQVLFVGGLFMQSNVEAIDWYMSAVHPRLKHISGYRFVIAGNTRCRPLPPIVQRAAADDRCVLHPDVADLSPLYQQSAVFANCMVHGAGVKMKTVNAAEKGTPIVSTAIGNEGTGLVDGQHICVAETQEAFASAIEDLLSVPSAAAEMAQRAQEFLCSRYRHAEQISALIELGRGGSAQP